jgi:hypothetical protein
MWLIDQLCEARIQQAIKNGEFDELPGSGKPLTLDNDSMIPEELRAAYRLLKNAGYIPPELQLRREIADVETLLRKTQEHSEYAQGARRLNCLLAQLSASGRSCEHLQFGQAYYERLLDRLDER